MTFVTYHTVWYALGVNKSKTTWLETGLVLLVESGPGSLTIERMCERMKKTKGSFYHHFNNRSQFEKDLLGYWEEKHTRELIALTKTDDSRQALEDLHRLALALPFERESAFREWARRSNETSRVVERVDRTRVGHLKALYSKQGLSDKEATTLAWLEYSLFLGTGMLGDSLPKEERSKIRESFGRWIPNDGRLA